MGQPVIIAEAVPDGMLNLLLKCNRSGRLFVDPDPGAHGYSIKKLGHFLIF